MFARDEDMGVVILLYPGTIMKLLGHLSMKTEDFSAWYYYAREFDHARATSYYYATSIYQLNSAYVFQASLSV